MAYSIHFDQVLPFVPYLLGGAWVTIQLASCAFIGGTLLGLILAVGVTYGGRKLRVGTEWYLSFFQNTPQLVTILLLFFGLGELRLFISPFWASAVGLMLAEAAYLAQIFRTGFRSVHRAEIEAAETLGIPRPKVIRYVILPHLLKVLFPPLANQFVLSTLYTSIGSLIGVEELTGRALNVESQTFRSLEVFVIVAFAYFMLTVIATGILYGLGRWLFRVDAKIF